MFRCRVSRGISDDVSADIKTLIIIIKTLGSFSLASIGFFESVDFSGKKLQKKKSYDNLEGHCANQDLLIYCLAK